MTTHNTGRHPAAEGSPALRYASHGRGAPLRAGLPPDCKANFNHQPNGVSSTCRQGVSSECRLIQTIPATAESCPTQTRYGVFNSLLGRVGLASPVIRADTD